MRTSMIVATRAISARSTGAISRMQPCLNLNPCKRDSAVFFVSLAHLMICDMSLMHRRPVSARTGQFESILPTCGCLARGTSIGSNQFHLQQLLRASCDLSVSTRAESKAWGTANLMANCNRWQTAHYLYFGIFCRSDTIPRSTRQEVLVSGAGGQTQGTLANGRNEEQIR